MNDLIQSHGGYRKLKSYQMTTIIYDLTVIFCKKYIDYKSRTNDQMVQAARSGRQNIAEGCQASGTSKKTELKLINVARASLEELLLDYEDYLRQNGFPLWPKDYPQAKEIRNLVYKTNWSNMTYMSYMNLPQIAANCLICLIHQANYLLDRQLQALSNAFLENGGFTERLYNYRKNERDFAKKCKPVVELYDKTREMALKMFGDAKDVEPSIQIRDNLTFWFGSYSDNEIQGVAIFDPNKDGIFDLDPRRYQYTIANIRRTNDGATIYTGDGKKITNDNIRKLTDALIETHEIVVKKCKAKKEINKSNS